jgi:hypothetical protein
MPVIAQAYGAGHGYVRTFLDEFDVAADSLERMGYQVGVSFRDSIHLVQGPDSFDLHPRQGSANSGYYFVEFGRPPTFVAGSFNSVRLLRAVHARERLRPTTGRRTEFSPVPPRSATPAPAPPAPVVILPLDSFPALDPAARGVLERRGCRVPQSPYASSKPNNVVQGRFGRRGQVDWAALCARDDRMMVVVAWSGAAACPDSIAETVEPVSDEHGLAVADSGYIEQHEQWYGGGRAFPIDHQGIDLGIEDKASEIWYCQDGVWHRLPGSD